MTSLHRADELEYCKRIKVKERRKTEEKLIRNKLSFKILKINKIKRFPSRSIGKNVFPGSTLVTEELNALIRR